MTRALARFACGTLAVALAIGATSGAAASNAKTVAQAGVLRLSDFPTGWKQSRRASSSDKELDALAAEIASCKPFLAFGRANKKNPRVKSPNFDLHQAHVTNAVSVYPSAAKATVAMRSFTDARLPDCFKQLFSAEFKAQLVKDKQVARQLRSVKVNIGRLDGVQIGNEAAAYKGTVDVGLKDGTVTSIGVAFIAVRVDGAIAGYSYTADTDISAALQPAIVSSISRLQDATASASASGPPGSTRTLRGAGPDRRPRGARAGRPRAPT